MWNSIPLLHSLSILLFLCILDLCNACSLSWPRMKWENAHLVHNGGKLQRKKARFKWSCQWRCSKSDRVKPSTNNHGRTWICAQKLVVEENLAVPLLFSTPWSTLIHHSNRPDEIDLNSQAHIFVQFNVRFQIPSYT